jgi:6-pyruvoyl-tetrahydropterin synthase
MPTKEINMTKLFYKNVTILDYAYLDEQHGPKGNSLIVDAEVDGPIDSQGMIIDFGKVKPAVKRIIDEYSDHRLFVTSKQANNYQSHLKQDELIYQWESAQGSSCLMNYKAPQEAFYLTGTETNSLKDLEKSLSELVAKYFERPELNISILLREEFSSKNSIPFFHYTHGLKHHDGNCQRLLHGHSNTILVKINGEQRVDIAEKLVSLLTNQNNNVHFIFNENIVKDSNEQVSLKYNARQGDFELTLPKSHTYILPCESTIEQLSQHFCQLVVENFSLPGDQVEVSAFEGIAKGATTVSIKH